MAGVDRQPKFVSGRGNFGNVLCFEHVEISIIVDDVTSAGHMMNTNTAGFDSFAEAYSGYSVDPGWIDLTRLMGTARTGGLRRKVF